ncbi:MAG: hypothetical protein Q7K29_01140 [Thermoleophilia bacterium]|nr:hypothetical protein [Thermoleophilia bacterium]
MNSGAPRPTKVKNAIRHCSKAEDDRSAWASRAMMPLLAAMLIVMFLAVLLLTSHPAGAATGGITLTSDKLIYHPDETVSFTLELDSGGQTLSGDLVMTVYPAASLTAANAFSQQPLSETKMQQDYSFSGREAAAVSAGIKDLKVGTGGYPIKVSLMSGAEESLSGTGWLAVVDPAAYEPLDLVLVWTVGSPPLRDQFGRFFSPGLVERCQADPRTADTLIQHPELTQKFPNIRTTYAIEGSLLDQLEDISNGFELREGDQEKTYPADSPESQTAKDCLAGFRFMGTAENIEVMSATYESTSLPLLAKQGWDDGSGQYRTGDDMLASSMELASVPRGAYAPGLDVTTDSLRYLAATGGEYTVLSGASRASVQGRLPEGAASYRVRDLSGERITAFFSNDDAAAALFSDTPDPAAFFAVLANSFAGAGSRLTIAASPSPSPILSADERQRVYAAIDGESWLSTMTLSDAKQKYRPETQPVTLLRYTDPATGYLSQNYYQRLDAVHGVYEAYRAGVDSETAEMQSLSRQMYTAESTYFISDSARPEAANLGLAYLDEIEMFTNSQFDRLKVEVDTPWLQSDSGGVAILKIVNENPYPFTVDLSLSGEGVSFPDGAGQRLRLEPGTIELEVPFNSDGWSRIDARLESRGVTLVEDGAGIHLVTTRGWIVILFTLAALIAGIAYAYIVTRPGVR